MKYGKLLQDAIELVVKYNERLVAAPTQQHVFGYVFDEDIYGVVCVHPIDSDGSVLPVIYSGDFPKYGIDHTAATAGLAAAKAMPVYLDARCDDE